MFNIKYLFTSSVMVFQLEGKNIHRILSDLELKESTKRKSKLLKYRKSFWGRQKLALLHLSSRGTLYALYTYELRSDPYLYRCIKRLVHKGYRVRLVKLQKQIEYTQLYL